MRILIERVLADHPQTLTCVVCGDVINVDLRRAILYDDRGLIQGDVCPRCVKSQPTAIKQKLHDRAFRLLHQAREWDEGSGERGDRAVELFRLAQENVTVPNVLQRWFRELQLLSEETQELEAARRSHDRVCCQQRSRLEQLLK